MVPQTTSKLPHTKESIFSIMSAVARDTGAVNLSQGFPDYAVSEALIGHMTDVMQSGYHQYAPMAGVSSLRRRIADKVMHYHGVSVDPDQELTITTGATQAIYTAISAVIQHGDEVVIIEPAYDSYAPSVLVNGGVPRYVRMTAEYDIDWDAVADQMTARTKLIIINTPHNPTGKCFDDADWEALTAIVLQHDCLVLSDEVYEHMVFDGRSPDTALARPELRDRVMACYSFGKLCHVTGWKLGYVIASPVLTHEIRKVHQFVVFSCHHPTQHAVARYLEDFASIDSLPTFFEQKRDILCEALREGPFEVKPAAGTYFQLITYDRRQVSLDDLGLCRWMAEKYQVAAIPLSGLYHDGYDGGALRLCFAKTTTSLLQGAERLRAVDFSSIEIAR